MTHSLTLRAALAFLIFVLGSLQAWDSNVSQAGLLVVLLVSLAIPLTPISPLLPVKQPYIVAALALAFILLLLAQLIAPIPLPGLFLVLVPAATGLIFAGLIKEKNDDK